MEIWKDIVGYEGIAQVSNLGRVKSINREFHNYTKKERFLKPTLTKSGKTIHLFKDGKQKSFKLERLVANAFLPNPNNHKYIKFIDDNPMNVNVSNLEWFEGNHLNIKDFIGKKFGYLTVIGDEKWDNHHKRIYKCECECGNKIQVNASYLYNGKVKSCGCLADDMFNKDPKSTQWANDNKLIFGECVKCGSKNHLHSHHILPRNMYPEYEENYANGVTLCRECHKEFHKIYGYKCDVANLVEYLGLHPYMKSMIELLIKHRQKNGKEDLEKAKHYIELLIELEYGMD